MIRRRLLVEELPGWRGRRSYCVRIDNGYDESRYSTKLTWDECLGVCATFAMDQRPPYLHTYAVEMANALKWEDPDAVAVLRSLHEAAPDGRARLTHEIVAEVA